jgi:hypothetical protein
MVHVLRFPGFIRLNRRLLGYTFPLIGSGIGFLVLYNNTRQGPLLLAMLVAANLAILMVSGRFFAETAFFESLRFSSVCVISILSSIMLIEIAFPFCLPQDYAQISELTRTQNDRRRLEGFRPDMIFGAPRGENIADIKKILSSDIAWHKPGKTFVYFGYDPNRKIRYLNLVKWNSTGHFDRDHSISKPSNVFRVVLIGDSYVESVQTPLESTFHKLTETSLNKSDYGPTPKRYELIALGNSGFGQREELDVLRTQGIKYDPDLVIILICGNDFCDDDPELKRELIISGGTVTPVVRELAHHGFFALGFMKKRMEDVIRNRIKMSPELLQWSEDDQPRVEMAWSRTLDYLKKSRDLCQDKGIDFLAIYVGSEIEVRYALDPRGTLEALKAMGGPHATMNWDITKSVRRMKTYCERFHINFVSLVGPLAAAQAQTGKVVFADHYSFFGHETVAKFLTCFMKEFTILGNSIQNSVNTCFGNKY